MQGNGVDSSLYDEVFNAELGTGDLDEFEWLNDISYGDYEGIGRYFVDNDYYDEYEISDELCDYFDFAEFGAHMADEKSGQFVNGGFIFCDGEDGFDSFMDKFEDESSSMTMGGM